MAGLSILDVVNDMLATLGELPLNSVTEGHPMAPTALRIISTSKSRELSKSWWFNKELTDLTPDTAGTIYLPDDTLRVDPQASNLNYVQRGRRLYKPFDPSSANKYKFDHPVRCWLVRDLEFEDLPVPAQFVVSYSAQLDFMKAYEADQAKFQQIGAMYRDAMLTLNAEHVRNSDVNILRHRGGVMESRTSVGVIRLQDSLNRY